MSNEKKYTPGPWAVSGGSHVKTMGDYRSVGKRTNVIADCRLANGGNDARLIAAAPELLEALEDLLAGWELMIGQYGYDPGEEPEDSLNMKARAAIAKAYGDDRKG